MKATIYTLTSEVHNSGTDNELFGTEQELNEALKAIMVDRLDSIKDIKWLTDTDLEFAEQCRKLIESGQIDPAWEIWCDHIKREDDYYWTGVHDIELPQFTPAAKAMERAIDALQYTVSEQFRRDTVEELAAGLRAMGHWQPKSETAPTNV